MTTPQTIPFTSIDLGVRGRTEYHDIESLAESIEHNGLIQPIVLSDKDQSDYPNFDGSGNERCYNLVAGGRRYHALKSLGVTELHHGVTSVPGTYGYVLKSETGTELSNLLTEIAENCDRADIPWQDNVRMIVKAARLVRRDGYAKGHEIVMRDMGSTLGVPYQYIRCAEALHDEHIANPQD